MTEVESPILQELRQETEKTYPSAGHMLSGHLQGRYIYIVL
jgi:hypothetical protein